MTKDAPIILSEREKEIYITDDKVRSRDIDCSNVTGAKIRIQLFPWALLKLNILNASDDIEINVICGNVVIHGEGITDGNVKISHEEVSCRLNGIYIDHSHPVHVDIPHSEIIGEAHNVGSEGG